MCRLIFCLLAAGAANAATPLYTGSSEKPSGGWTAVHGLATPDSNVSRAGARSLRIEPAPGAPNARISSGAIPLVIGKRYQLSSWVRTENLTVHDLDRTPIGSGAALAMASVPFDVHSAWLGGTQPWTHLSLHFIATQAQDQIVLVVGNGGAAGKVRAIEGAEASAFGKIKLMTVEELDREYLPLRDQALAVRRYL